MATAAKLFSRRGGVVAFTRLLSNNDPAWKKKINDVFSPQSGNSSRPFFFGTRSFASSKRERRYTNKNKEFPRVIFEREETPKERATILMMAEKKRAMLEMLEEKNRRRTREEILRDDVQRTTKRAHAAVRAANWNRVEVDAPRGEEEEGEISTSSRKENESEDETMVPIERQKSIRVGILGVPNAGKSELVNALVGAKVSAVSRKTNTTRMETIGTTTREDTQLVFLDLPGIVGPEHYRNKAHESKVTMGWAAASTCDAILFVVDANRQARKADWRVRETIDSLTEQMRKLRYEEFLSPEDEYEDADDVGEDDEDLVTNKTSPPPGILVLNKVDLMDRSKRAEQLPELVQSLATDPKKTFSKAFPVSALHSVGTEALFNHLLTLAKYRPWDYSPSESTAMNDRSRAIEVVRESVYDQVHKEICYGIEIVHKSWEDFRDGSVRIEHDLFVKSGGNRKIVVGKDGRTIGQIGVKARHVLEALLGRRVHLLLNVRVRRTNARHSQQFLSELY
jgi:GTP-binding protein Era